MKATPSPKSWMKKLVALDYCIYTHNNLLEETRSLDCETREEQEERLFALLLTAT